MATQPSKEERQAALDNIPEADIAKIQAKTGKKIKVETEDIIEAEFLMKFGWQAYWALYPEKDPTKGINAPEMMRLLAASRKVDAQTLYISAQASFIGAAASRAKTPSSAFAKVTAKLLRNTEADI